VLDAERDDVCRWMRRAAADGLVVGRSGNVSVRAGDLVVVTPTGVDPDDLRPQDVPVVDLDGRPVDGALLPSSELPMHLATYAGDASRCAVVHTHAVHATAVSTLVEQVPAVSYVLGLLGGPVRVAPYATYGTDALAAGVAAALDGRSGCLLRNHGTLTTGPDLARAYEGTVQLEWACRVWLLARAAGTPSLLPDDELARVADKLAAYGQPAAPAGRPDPRPPVGRSLRPAPVPGGAP
jgi:L-fuculose-phosphate aldolase